MCLYYKSIIIIIKYPVTENPKYTIIINTNTYIKIHYTKIIDYGYSSDTYFNLKPK